MIDLEPDLPAAEHRRLFETMLATRRLDERLASLAAHGRVGPWAGAGGQEALAAGAACALRPTDWIFPGYRDHAALLWRGRGVGPIVAQALGAPGAAASGRAAPLHLAWRDGRIASVPGAPGAHLPHAAGLAAAARRRGRDDLALALFGEAATARAAFHAAMELARALQAPVVFVCAGAKVAARAAGYGIEARRVDGTDVLAVTAAVRAAGAWARGGQGACLVEATLEANAAGAIEDPLERYRAHLRGRGIATGAWEREAEARVAAELDAAVAQAEAAGAAPADLFEHVRAHPTRELERQRAEATARAEGKRSWRA